MPLTTEHVGAADIRVWSEGTGTPLLFLHGFERHPGDASFLRAFATKHHVIAPEHPGYGESTGFDRMRDVIDMALHYRRVVEATATGPVDVVGHCLGGMFAAEFAATSPHLVRKLVLVAPYGLWRDDVPIPDPFAIEPAAFARAKWGSNTPPATEPSIIIPDADAPNAAVFDRARNLAAATKFMWPIPDRGLRRRLAYIAAPTLIVQGEDDGLVPAIYANEFASLIPGAHVARIAGSGHLPMIDHESEFLSLVEGFLAD